MPPYSAISLRKLADSAERTGSILSVGYDPAPQQFPIDDISGYDPNLPDPMNVSDREYVKEYITDYFASFLNECEEKKHYA